MKRGPFVRLGVLDLTVRQEMVQRTSIMKPIIRTVQPNPRVEWKSRRFRAKGRMTPASEEPVEAMLIASGLLRKKYWPTALTAGV